VAVNLRLRNSVHNLQQRRIASERKGRKEESLEKRGKRTSEIASFHMIFFVTHQPPPQFQASEEKGKKIRRNARGEECHTAKERNRRFLLLSYSSMLGGRLPSRRRRKEDFIPAALQQRRSRGKKKGGQQRGKDRRGTNSGRNRAGHALPALERAWREKKERASQ